MERRRKPLKRSYAIKKKKYERKKKKKRQFFQTLFSSSLPINKVNGHIFLPILHVQENNPRILQLRNSHIQFHDD